jgi:hypothetical protein
MAFRSVVPMQIQRVLTLVVLERAFEKRYDRAPRIAFMVARLQSDLFMSLVCWSLAIAAGFIALYFSTGFA